MNEHMNNPERPKDEAYEARQHEHEGSVDRLQDKHEKADDNPDVSELHRHAAEKAVSAKEISIGEQHEQTRQDSPHIAQKELKDDAYRRTLRSVRRRLNPADRALSKIVHQPVIDAVSNFAGKTVARPSAILGGGLFALAGSSLLLYMSKHYGFEYNFSIFLALFLGGFAVGLIAELLTKIAKN